MARRSAATVASLAAALCFCSSSICVCKSLAACCNFLFVFCNSALFLLAVAKAISISLISASIFFFCLIASALALVSDSKLI